MNIHMSYQSSTTPDSEKVQASEFLSAWVQNGMDASAAPVVEPIDASNAIKVPQKSEINTEKKIDSTGVSKPSIVNRGTTTGADLDLTSLAKSLSTISKPKLTRCSTGPPAIMTSLASNQPRRTAKATVTALPSDLVAKIEPKATVKPKLTRCSTGPMILTTTMASEKKKSCVPTVAALVAQQCQSRERPGLSRSATGPKRVSAPACLQGAEKKAVMQIAEKESAKASRRMQSLARHAK